MRASCALQECKKDEKWVISCLKCMVSIRATAILASTVLSQNKQLLRQHQEIQDSVRKLFCIFFHALKVIKAFDP